MRRLSFMVLLLLPFCAQPFRLQSLSLSFGSNARGGISNSVSQDRTARAERPRRGHPLQLSQVPDFPSSGARPDSAESQEMGPVVAAAQSARAAQMANS